MCEEMDVCGVVSVMDVLCYLLGVNIQIYGVDLCGYDYFNLCGFINVQNISNYFNGLCQLVVGFGMFCIEVYGLEWVEVLCGVVLVIIGQVDLGGVVNCISKLVGVELFDELVLLVGMFNMCQLVVDFSGMLDEDGQVQVCFVVLVCESDIQFCYGNGCVVENDCLYLVFLFKLCLSSDISFILLVDYFKDCNGSSCWIVVNVDGSFIYMLVGDFGIDCQCGE